MLRKYKQYLFDIAVIWAVWIIFVAMVIYSDIENVKHCL
jgi:hypothetical protein